MPQSQRHALHGPWSGSATRQGMIVSGWDGAALGGVLSGNARIRWTDDWSIDGELRGRAIDAGKFAPALVSGGRAEGRGTVSMNGSDVSALAASARIRGTFTVVKGALANVDLSRIVQTGNPQAGGKTPFSELTAEGTLTGREPRRPEPGSPFEDLAR